MSPPPPLLQQSDKSFPNEKIVRDVGKWVESVRELNLALENEKKSVPKVKKVKKIKKKKVVAQKSDNPQKPQEILTPLIPFSLKEEYKNLKLPLGWIAGTSGNNIIFNKLKVTSFHSTYKMVAERGVLIAGDCSVHVFINGSEVPGTNSKKIESIDDVKKAIKDVDSFKICRKPVKKLASKTKIKPTRKPGA